MHHPNMFHHSEIPPISGVKSSVKGEKISHTQRFLKSFQSNTLAKSLVHFPLLFASKGWFSGYLPVCHHPPLPAHWDTQSSHLLCHECHLLRDLRSSGTRTNFLEPLCVLLQQVASPGLSDIHLLTSALKISGDKKKHGAA